MSANNEQLEEPAGEFERYRVPDTGSISETVVRAVASATDQEPEDLPLLYESIDPDALNQLLDGAVPDSPGGLCISFQYAGHYVAAERGRVLVRPTSVE